MEQVDNEFSPFVVVILVGVFFTFDFLEHALKPLLFLNLKWMGTDVTVCFVWEEK